MNAWDGGFHPVFGFVFFTGNGYEFALSFLSVCLIDVTESLRLFSGVISLLSTSVGLSYKLCTSQDSG